MLIVLFMFVIIALDFGGRMFIETKVKISILVRFKDRIANEFDVRQNSSIWD